MQFPPGLSAVTSPATRGRSIRSIEALPPVMKAGDPNGTDPGWLGQFIRFAVAETRDKRAGGETVLTKLSELMLIDVVRRYIATLPAEKAGWLAGLRDPLVGKALALIHDKRAHDWTIESLAKQAGLSRSVLAERFTAVVGIPPMHYLAKWRMQIASELLSSGNADVGSIAARIGYESEAAFSRAFKKMIGVPPSAWRRGARSKGSARLRCPFMAQRGQSRHRNNLVAVGQERTFV